MVNFYLYGFFFLWNKPGLAIPNISPVLFLVHIPDRAFFYFRVSSFCIPERAKRGTVMVSWFSFVSSFTNTLTLTEIREIQSQYLWVKWRSLQGGTVAQISPKIYFGCYFVFIILQMVKTNTSKNIIYFALVISIKTSRIFLPLKGATKIYRPQPKLTIATQKLRQKASTATNTHFLRLPWKTQKHVMK